MRRWKIEIERCKHPEHSRGRSLTEVVLLRRRGLGWKPFLMASTETCRADAAWIASVTNQLRERAAAVDSAASAL